jgi:centromeric protein E
MRMHVATIFAYGQTSSGKTYTMRGVTESAISDIYEYIQKNQDRNFVLKVSALEIYNEVVKDLLTSDTNPLRLLDDKDRGTIVEKLKEEVVQNSGHLQEIIKICEAHRQVGETHLNDMSSRSHQIIRLTVESQPQGLVSETPATSLVASLNFVDLAGSERASQTHADGARLKEGAHINRSLLTLSTCIRKLRKQDKGCTHPIQRFKTNSNLAALTWGKCKDCHYLHYESCS